MKEKLTPGYAGMPMRKMNAERTAKLIALLLEDAYTVKQLAEALDVSQGAVRDYVYALRNLRPRLVRVAEWVEGRSGIRPLWVAAYQMSPGKDAPRPPKKSGAERCREYRQRKRAKEVQSLLGGMQA